MAGDTATPSPNYYMTPGVLRRSLLIALLVGSVLTAINQGNLLLDGEFPASLYWKIPLTYCVPFLVATAGAVLNARDSVRP